MDECSEVHWLKSRFCELFGLGKGSLCLSDLSFPIRRVGTVISQGNMPVSGLNEAKRLPKAGGICCCFGLFWGLCSYQH